MFLLAAASTVTCLSLSAVGGDTVKCNGENMRIMGPGAPFESGIDAPEIFQPDCQKELLLGVQAKLRLEELLRQPDAEVEDSGERDRWGRPLVWVRLSNGTTAGQVLFEDGYAVHWHPAYRAAWCD